jgi:hypothetical protein
MRKLLPPLFGTVLLPEASMPPISAYAQLNARIMPLDRGERYEDPLAEALAKVSVHGPTLPEAR